MLEKAAIYLDANAGAPLRPEVVEALLGQLRESAASLANPSSAHVHGRKARRFLSLAREAVAESLGTGIDPSGLLFTSSGSEANQAAIRSVLGPRLEAREKTHWILSATEHDSVLQCVPWFERNGGIVSWLPVDSDGRIRTDLLDGMLQPETALISLLWVNNETGVICEDLKRTGELARGRGILLHLDGAQAWGKIALDLDRLGADLVSFSGHKIGAPAGTGVLWARSGLAVSSPIQGKQSEGRRGGTENLLGLLGLGAAASRLNPAEWAVRVSESRDRIEAKVLRAVPGARVHGSRAKRVANTSNFGFDGIEGAGLTAALDLAGFSVSSGSACASGVEEPSHVLKAMGFSPALARSAIRVSLAAPLEPEVEDRFVEALAIAVSRIRGPR